MDENVKQRIDQEVQNNKVVLFMKGTPDAPMCGFSAQVAGILGQMGVGFHSVDVIGEPVMREAVKEYTNWPTIPQVFINGKFIGGCDIFTELYQRGELETMLKDAGAM